ncbi:hypothetical protein HYDPIDRAFT_138045 [Hydnomerulius pinastri MD-312]|uniref:Unplaced genomic scaffold scaffold_30, whole genome shotgun sequence n=1 Tax=Hydnomerulius pinastri MD-312 TaxID=994086 RepID=A0A0C9WBI5_9AGAM|nr:hypothetical protein HYDPIDRAFT_138045 [Hydnomerulius pinastri MD-312]
MYLLPEPEGCNWAKAGDKVRVSADRILRLADDSDELAVVMTGDLTDSPVTLYLKAHRSSRVVADRKHKSVCFVILQYNSDLLWNSFEDGEYKDASTLETCLEFERALLDLRPLGHPSRHRSLSSLSSLYGRRFHISADVIDLNLATTYAEEAVAIIPPERTPDLIESLHALARIFRVRYDALQDIVNLRTAIEHQRAAFALQALGSPNPAALQGQAYSLWECYKVQGGEHNLHEAIKILEELLDCRPKDHPRRSDTLDFLAGALWTRYQLQGHASDLHRAIELEQEAFSLRPPGHSDHHHSLDNLGSSLWTRYQLQGDVSDLHEAIDLGRKAMDLRPPGHPDRAASAGNLAGTLWTRYQVEKAPEDLHWAILLQQEALQARSPSDPERHQSLSNLALSLRSRHELQHAPEDLNEAITLQEEAVSLQPAGYLHRAVLLDNLASSLEARYRLRHDVSDLHRAIELQQEVLVLWPPGHPDHPSSVQHLSNCLLHRYQDSQETTTPTGTDDFDEAFRLFSTLASLPAVSSTALCEATQEWVKRAEEFNHVSVLEAYKTSLSALDRHVAALASVVLRHQVMGPLKSLVNDAFSCALRRNNPTEAVQLFEQGRSMLWTQLARFDTPLTELRSQSETGLHLVEKFEQLSSLLQTFAKGRDSRGPLVGSAVSDTDTTERYWKLVGDWESVVEEIRRQEGFERFLLPPLLADLQEAASEGPVIIVNASQYTSDALIMLHDHPPIHVPLSITLSDIEVLAVRFAKTIKDFPASHPMDDVDESSHKEKLRQYRNLLVSDLRYVWRSVVSPVVEELETIYPTGLGGRIWWCPAAKLSTLPLHAAGPYRRGEKNLSALYISSYTPSLSALIRARGKQKVVTTNGTVDQRHFPSLILIGQAAPGLSQGQELQNVDKELMAIRSVLPETMPLDRLVGDLATDEGVVGALRAHNWVHLACHGSQDLTRPFDSSFAMKNGPLTLLRIIQAKFDNPELAFLSACHTAVGDKSTPDEVIHLAAAMQFAGFRSVIGTMWGVDDSFVHHTVTAFYRNMFRGTEKPDFRRSAECLNKATRDVLEVVPIDQRIVFIHIGA